MDIIQKIKEELQVEKWQVEAADDAMYKVKKNGKNDFAYYEKSTEE